jgi:DNA/RNA endonuclease G (NUC1)
MLVRLSDLLEAKRPDPREAAKAAVDKQRASTAKRLKTAVKNAKARRADVLAANKQKRKERSAKISQSLKDKNAAKAAAQGPHDKVPAQLAHVMMALRYKAKRRFDDMGAWNVARWSLRRHGYLKNYKKDAKLSASAVAQTAKGFKRSAEHAAEKKPLNRGVAGDHASKYHRFAKMMKRLAPRVT